MRRGAIRRRRSTTTRAAAPTGISTSPIDEVKALADDGKLGNDRVLTVRTGLDTGLQHKAESVHRGHAARQRAGLSRPSGRDRHRRHRRARARDGRRARLWREPVQPRHRRAAPARLVVQDFRLSDRAADRQVPQGHGRSTRRASASATIASTITTARAAARCRSTRRSRNRSTRRRSGCRSRSARPIGRRSKPYHLGKIADARPLQDRRDGARDGPDDAARRHGVAAGRRRRGEDDRHGRRQCRCSPTAASARRPTPRSKSAIRAARSSTRTTPTGRRPSRSSRPTRSPR